jgi:hypothetical protein
MSSSTPVKIGNSSSLPAAITAWWVARSKSARSIDPATGGVSGNAG